MLKLENIHVTFNHNTASEVHALQNVFLDVGAGDFVTVIGANGAGKSTLFNVIAGTNPIDKGKIWLRDQNIKHWAEPRRSAHIGRVFQSPGLGTCPGLTINENLSLAAMRGKRRGLAPALKRHQRDQFYELLKEIGMGLENRLDADVGLLSGGQRQAVTLIMATLTKPEILLLDEHTAALDPNAATQIIDLTVKLAEEHKLTVIMITHSMAQACTVGNRIVMMNRGKILFEIKDNARHTVTVDDLIGRFRSIRENGDLSDRTLLD